MCIRDRHIPAGEGEARHHRNRNPQQCAHRGIENGVQIAGKNSGIPQDQFKCLNLKALGSIANMTMAEFIAALEADENWNIES